MYLSFVFFITLTNTKIIPFVCLVFVSSIPSFLMLAPGDSVCSPLPSHPSCLAHSGCSINICKWESFDGQKTWSLCFLVSPPPDLPCDFGQCPSHSGPRVLPLCPSSKAFGACGAESPQLLQDLPAGWICPQAYHCSLPDRGKAESENMCFVDFTCTVFPRRWAHDERKFTSLPELLWNKDRAGLKSSTFGRKQYLPEIE